MFLLKMKISYVFFYFLFAGILLGQVNTKELPEFMYSNPQSHVGFTMSINAADDSLKILPLGNSITFDKRTNDPRIDADKPGYRLSLYDSLANLGILFDFIGSEKSGWNFLPNGYEDNAGFPGIKDSELLNLLETGWRIQPPDVNDQITSGPYLETYLPDVILLHIGTNGNDGVNGTSAEDIENILDEVNRVEILTNKEIKVVVAKIIDRVPLQSYVNEFNYNVDSMATDRISNPLNPAYPDNIVVVDMEDGANIIYAIDSMGTVGNGLIGDMNDQLHPNDKGHLKMANVWFDALKDLYPNPIMIVEQPEEIFSPVGVSVEFSVTVNSSSPVRYQWKKNDEIIPGAIDSFFVTEPLTLEDNLSTFSCEVFSGFYKEVSNEASVIITDSTTRVTAGLVAEYNFEEAEGDKIVNSVEDYPDLDFQINNITNTKWIPFGIRISGSPSIETSLPAADIYNRIIETNEMTIEAWLEPENITQIGPARIFTFSESVTNRNFTFSQDADSFEVRFRTSATTSNGKPSTFSHENSASTNLTHVAYVREANGDCKIFINGVLNNSINVAGDLSVWDSTYTLALADEVQGGRPWMGDLYLVSLYNRALKDQEIEHNYNVKFNGYDFLLNKPLNLVGNILEDDIVQLDWEDDSDNEIGFVIERRANKADSLFYIVDTVLTDVVSYTDSTMKFDSSYIYRVRAYNEGALSEYSNEVEISNLPVGVEIGNLIAFSYQLNQNYPNPFNPITKISYSLRKDSKVSLKIFNSLGELVRVLVDQNVVQQGIYTKNFDARNLASGIYFYRLVAESVDGSEMFVDIKKAILLK